MKRIILTLFMILVMGLPFGVSALSVSESDLVIDKGDEQLIDLYAEVDSEVTEVNFSLVYTSYDVPAYFNIASGLRDEAVGIKHRIVFSVPVSGKIKLGSVKVSVVNNPKIVSSSINVHTASAITSSGETIKLNAQMINVTINKNVDKPDEEEQVKTTETDTEEIDEDKVDSNMLSKIESKIVKIELKKDVFEYNIKIKDDVSELDLKPIAVDEDYEVEISNQKIAELNNNQIVIKVKNDDVVEEYKINVKVIEDVELEIDDTEFDSSYSYKGKWIVLIIIFGVVLFAGLLLVKKK